VPANSPHGPANERVLPPNGPQEKAGSIQGRRARMSVLLANRFIKPQFSRDW